MSAPKIETFELGVLERVTLASILSQQQGNLMTMQVIEQFIKDLSLTEEEIEAWGFKAEGTHMQWSATADTKKPFGFTPWRLSKIREVLKALDERGAIGIQHLPLFTLFCPTPLGATDATELAEEFAALHPVAVAD